MASEDAPASRVLRLGVSSGEEEPVHSLRELHLADAKISSLLDVPDLAEATQLRELSLHFNRERKESGSALARAVDPASRSFRAQRFAKSRAWRS
jgi:hypothetical protein